VSENSEKRDDERLRKCVRVWRIENNQSNGNHRRGVVGVMGYEGKKEKGRTKIFLESMHLSGDESVREYEVKS
jgi:hypothetical protein